MNTNGASEVDAPGTDFERARRETIRYHEELYGTTGRGQPDGWLKKPHPLIFDALRLLSPRHPVTAYDLGAGIGRHTVPMMRLLPPGSHVHAVDLLASALSRLEATAPQVDSTVLHTRQADLEDFVFPTSADLCFAFSAIEHLRDEVAVRAVLRRIATATRAGGVVALGIVADRFEVHRDGCRRPALLESGLSVATTCRLLAEVFDDFVVDRLVTGPAAVDEHRDGVPYTLSSTLVTWLARRPE